MVMVSASAPGVFLYEYVIGWETSADEACGIHVFPVPPPGPAGISGPVVGDAPPPPRGRHRPSISDSPLIGLARIVDWNKGVILRSCAGTQSCARKCDVGRGTITWLRSTATALTTAPTPSTARGALGTNMFSHKKMTKNDKQDAFFHTPKQMGFRLKS